MQRPLILLIALLLPAQIAAAQTDPEMGWQDAVLEFSSLRTRAETCLRVFKRSVGEDIAGLNEGEFAYADAKIAMDRAIDQMIGALIEEKAPATLDALKGDLKTAVGGLDDFCETAKAASVAVDPQNAKNPALIGLAGVVIGGAISAGTAIVTYFWKREDDLIGTLKTQLEATRWPAFGEVEP